MRGRGASVLAAIWIASSSPCLAAEPTYTILLENGNTLVVARIEPTSLDNVRTVTPDSFELFIPNHKIKSITDESGLDLTQRVLRDRKSVGMPVAKPDTRASVPDEQSGFCLRPQSLPKCKSFLVLDLAISYQLEDSYSDDQAVGSLDLGYMRNLSPKNAIGGSFVGVSGQSTERLGFRGRYRRWLSGSVGLDGTAGLMFAWSGTGSVKFPWFIASIGVQVSGMIGVTLEVEQPRYQYVDPGSAGEFPIQSDTQWRVGGRLASLPLVLAALVYGILLAAYVSAYN